MTHVSDETLSAMLDDEPATPDDVAHVDGCGPCQDRMEQLRAVTVALRAQTPLPAAHLREAAVAVALDERPRTGVIRRLRSVRRDEDKKPLPARRMSAASAAAALVVALAVGGWALSQVGSGGGSTGANQAATLNDGRTDSAATAGANDAEASGSYAGWLDAGYIGEFSDVSEVAAAAKSHMDKSDEEQAEYSTVMGGPDVPCVERGGTVVWSASLTYEGTDAWTRVLFVTASSWTLEVLRRTDCVLVATQMFEPTNPR